MVWKLQTFRSLEEFAEETASGTERLSVTIVWQESAVSCGVEQYSLSRLLAEAGRRAFRISRRQSILKRAETLAVPFVQFLLLVGNLRPSRPPQTNLDGFAGAPWLALVLDADLWQRNFSESGRTEQLWTVRR